MRVSKVEYALTSAGEKIVRVVDQFADGGGRPCNGGCARRPTLRFALKEIARRMRTAIADSLGLGDDDRGP
jgi:hypothetical protein